MEKDCGEWKPSRKEHLVIRLRSVMCAASQLPGRGPTDVDDAPAPACY